MTHLSEYRPRIARPFRQGAVFCEVLPCAALRPYVCCFWGGEAASAASIVQGEPDWIIPDGCADVIFRVNETRGTVCVGFAGVSDACGATHFSADTADRFSTFGIRFYAWAVYRFSGEGMSGTLNGYFDARERFGWLCSALSERLPGLATLRERIALAERLLLAQLEASGENSRFDEAVLTLLSSRGSMSIAALAGEVFFSTRQLERMFREYAGISPKRIAGIIRYQSLWQDALRSGFDVQDAVLKYGFTDEAHLLHEFKRYHGMGLRQARALALADVAKLQDRRSNAVYTGGNPKETGMMPAASSTKCCKS